jgi:hypothetical protein
LSIPPLKTFLNPRKPMAFKPEYPRKIVKLFYQNDRLMGSINLLFHPNKEGKNEKSNGNRVGVILYGCDFRSGFGTSSCGFHADQDEAQPQETPHQEEGRAGPGDGSSQQITLAQLWA